MTHPRLTIVLTAILLPLPSSADFLTGYHAALEHSEDGKSEALAIAELLPLAQMGDVEAQYWLCSTYSFESRFRHPTESDRTEAFNWCLRAAEVGNSDAQEALGDMYRFGSGVEENEQSAFEWFLKAAEGGNPRAQYQVAQSYKRGDVVPRDSTRAMHWLQLAATATDPADKLYAGEDAKAELDVLTALDLEAPPPNYEELVPSLRARSNQGDARAQFGLGLLLITYSIRPLQGNADEGVKWLRRAAAEESPYSLLAQSYLGRRLRFLDPTEAVRVLRSAAEKGDMRSQSILGDMLNRGDGTKKDEAKAEVWWRKAAEGGDVDAIVRISRLTRNTLEGVRWQLALAQKGDLLAQYTLGFIFEKGLWGTGQNCSQAVSWYQKVASSNLRLSPELRAGAQWALGRMYLEGRCVTKDLTAAIQLFSVAAERGFSEAEIEMASLFEDGRGVQRDRATAASWFRRAARNLSFDAESVKSQYDVGYYYSRAEDYQEARPWLLKASEGGSCDAENMLAEQARLGLGRPQDYREALQRLSRCAERGHALSQSELGFMYQTGTGVPQDFVEAHKWYNLAAAHGEEGARVLRDALALKMTNEQVSRAQELARNWKPAKAGTTGVPAEKPIPARVSPAKP